MKKAGYLVGAALLAAALVPASAASAATRDAGGLEAQDAGMDHTALIDMPALPIEEAAERLREMSLAITIAPGTTGQTSAVRGAPDLVTAVQQMLAGTNMAVGWKGGEAFIRQATAGKAQPKSK